jgi:hypothetical protein
MNLHPESELESLRKRRHIAAASLYNMGLTDPHCAVAYYGAIYAGANAEQAFEAARRHQLLVLAPVVVTASYKADEYRGGDHARQVQMRNARAEQIERVRSLVNPFAQGVESMDLPLRLHVEAEQAQVRG